MMPFWRLYYHLIWSTKNREPFIDEKLELRLYPYLIDKANRLDCQVFAIGGWLEHVHVVTSIPPKYSVAETVQRLKGASSHDFEGLAWQRGYGALSIGERQKSIAIEYVENQKVHHGQQTTLAWLEREDDDESETGKLSVREGRGEYDADSPF
jgi:putative transposase